MEMKKMKMSSEPRDRLSELHDSLILSIFEFLPMNDIVRTQILSHRWENLWTLTPYLHFENKFENLDSFRNFINRSISSWRGGKIQKFKVRIHKFDKSLFGDVDLWVHFAVNNGVEEFDTSFSEADFNPFKHEYCVPKCLYSCSSLRNLSIMVSRIEINGNMVQWNQLKSLKLVCFRITQDAIDLILSGCRVLEVFKLIFGDKDNNLRLSFRSTSLKEMSVHKIRCRNVDDISMDTELRIWTPNLETLRIYGGSYGKCLLMDVSSLTRARLSFSKNDHLGAILSQILPTIRHVERLTLSDCCIKVLGAMTMLSPFPSVTFLSLNIGSFEELDQIVGLLESFSKLQTLIVREAATIDPKNQKNFKPNPSESFLEELRIVNVTWRMRDFWIFPLIEILLKYASKLENMVILLKPTTPSSGSSDSLLLASQSQTKLLRMPRSSPNAKLFFIED